MKSYIDVSFTIEEDLSHWLEEEKNMVIQEIHKATELAKIDLLEKLSDYEDNIKNLNVVITFEEREVI